MDNQNPQKINPSSAQPIHLDISDTIDTPLDDTLSNVEVLALRTFQGDMGEKTNEDLIRAKGMDAKSSLPQSPSKRKYVAPVNISVAVKNEAPKAQAEFIPPIKVELPQQTPEPNVEEISFPKVEEIKPQEPEIPTTPSPTYDTDIGIKPEPEHEIEPKISITVSNPAIEEKKEKERTPLNIAPEFPQESEPEPDPYKIEHKDVALKPEELTAFTQTKPAVPKPVAPIPPTPPVTPTVPTTPAVPTKPVVPTPISLPKTPIPKKEKEPAKQDQSQPQFKSQFVRRTPFKKEKSVPTVPKAVPSFKSSFKSSASTTPPVKPVSPPPVKTPPLPPVPPVKQAPAESVFKKEPASSTITPPPNLRTYKHDAGDTLKNEKINSAQILIAEQKRREAEKKQADMLQSQDSIKNPKNLVWVISGILLVVIALGLIGYFGFAKWFNTNEKTPITESNSFLFTFDQGVSIETQDKTNLQIQNEVEKAMQSIHSSSTSGYTQIVIQSTLAETGEKRLITAREFFNVMDMNPPITLSRSVASEYVHGIYKNTGNFEPFIVVKLIDYENAYNSMFGWEQNLVSDMELFFPAIQKVKQNSLMFNMDNSQETSTTSASTTTPVVDEDTASSTQETATSSVFENIIESSEPDFEFVDIILSNKDSRALRDSNGSPYFYYVFLDKNTLLFAQDPKLIPEILRKMKERQLIR